MKKFIVGTQKNKSRRFGGKQKSTPKKRQMVRITGLWEKDWGLSGMVDDEYLQLLIDIATKHLENKAVMRIMIFPNNNKQTKNSPHYSFVIGVDENVNLDEGGDE